MKKSLFLLFTSLFFIAGCAEQEQDVVYDNSPVINNSGVGGTQLDYVSLVNNGQMDNTTDNGTGISLNGTGANLNMAERLGAYNSTTGQYHERMPMQKMDGVWFPHDFHRRIMNNTTFSDVNGNLYTPIQGCGSCHNLYEGGSFSTFLKRSIDAGRININADNNTAGTAKKVVSGETADNPAHAFCWNACHSKIDPSISQAPLNSQCSRCHRMTNIRTIREAGFDPFNPPATEVTE